MTPDTTGVLPDGYERLEIAVPGSDPARVLDVVTYGPASDRAVLFHSGTPSGPTALPVLAETAAAHGLRWVTYGRPGYGRSTPQPGRRVAGAAADSVAILDSLGVKEFISIGWSGGGPHALACGALAPVGRCLGVGALASVAPSDAGGIDWTAGMGKENVVEFDLARKGGDEFTAFLRDASSVMMLVTQDDLGAAFGDLAAAPDLVAIEGPMGAYLVASMGEAFASGVAGWGDDDVAFLTDWGFGLEDVTVPTVLWQGTEDRMVPLAHGEWLAGRVPGARYRRLEGDGHISMWDRAAAEIAELLDHQPGEGPWTSQPET